MLKFKNDDRTEPFQNLDFDRVFMFACLTGISDHFSLSPSAMFVHN